MVGALGCGVDPGLLQDLPDGRGADFASQAEQFAVDPSISPSQVLPREAQDQLPQCFRRRWSARTAVWTGPLPGHEACVPAQDRPWSEQQRQPGTLLRVHQPEQRCHDSSIAAEKLRSWLGALRDTELVPEHQNLDVFRRTRPGQQRKPSEELTRELIDQTYRHDPA